MCGCQPEQKHDYAADFRDSWQSPASAGVEHPRSLAVAQGSSPLFYRGQQAGILHITDVTTGTELASTPVGSGSIVWVNEATGVFADSQKLRAGPLPGGHTYSMTLELDPSSTWRSRVEAPRPAKPAQSH